MTLDRRRYRIETSGTRRSGVPRGAAGKLALTSPVADGRSSEGNSPGLAELARSLHAMRSAIATTKREVAELERSPSGAPGMHRAASELGAVSLATEEAATTILGAVEEIERAANRAKSGEADGRDQAEVILGRVRLLYEACNFQDISGQRIGKVVATLKYVEARIDLLISIWGEGATPASPDHASPGIAILAGPALPGDAGHVSQQDVDAFFA